MTEKISDLLGRLKVADPETWRIIYYRLKTSAGFEDWNELALTENGQDILQGCIQRAIQALGWVFEIEGKVGIDRSYPPTAGYIESVYKLDKGYDGDHYNPRHKYLLSESIADAPAGAILAAYLEAMEASK